MQPNRQNKQRRRRHYFYYTSRAELDLHSRPVQLFHSTLSEPTQAGQVSSCAGKWAAVALAWRQISQTSQTVISISRTPINLCRVGERGQETTTGRPNKPAERPRDLEQQVEPTDGRECNSRISQIMSNECNPICLPSGDDQAEQLKANRAETEEVLIDVSQ